MIGPEEIKIEIEKVKAVLDWLIPKLVKDVQKFLGLANYYRRFCGRICKNSEAIT